MSEGTKTPLLEIRNLSVTFSGRGGAKPVEAVKGVSLDLDRGKTLALVGESGSGKSVTALSVLQLLPYPIAVHGPESSIRFAGEELIGAAPERLRRVRGNRIAMVFQEPMTSLNPLHTLERQIAETLLIHRHMTTVAARRRTLARAARSARASRPNTRPCQGGDARPTRWVPGVLKADQRRSRRPGCPR